MKGMELFILVNIYCFYMNYVSCSSVQIPMKLFYLSLSERTVDWYKLLKNGHSLGWEEIVPLFYSKFYPPSEIHQDRNLIYNFWPHEGESIVKGSRRLTRGG